MSKLFRAGLRRYIKNIVFWITLFVSIMVGVFSGMLGKTDRLFHDIYIIVAFIVYAILISLLIGVEFGDGVFRNKIVAGYSRRKIFFSEYIIAIIICLLLVLVTVVTFSLFNWVIYKQIPIDILAKIALGFVLHIISLITFISVTSMLVTKKAVSAIIALAFVFISYMVAFEININLNLPEYGQAYSFVDGIPVEIEGELQKNPAYIDSPQRELYTFIFNVLPTGQIIKYTEIVEPYLTIRHSSGALSVQEIKLLNTMPLYSVGTIIVFLISGYLIFRKKDFK